MPGLIGVVMCVMCSAAAPAMAQEGHPLQGSWVGAWGPTRGLQNRVVIVMEWTGKELAGSINPGPKAIPFRVATVNPDDWSVHIEADSKDAQARAVTYVIDGKLDHLGSYNRDLSGTWSVGSIKNQFKVYRQ